MNYDKNIYAEVVFDGVETTAPARMGAPRADQLQGTALERLVELAGRVCYDSLGKGRSSSEYHAHIREVGHGSVLEHANLTIEIRGEYGAELRSGRTLFDEVAMVLVNRPGVWVARSGSEDTYEGIRITLNLRSVVEWAQHDNGILSWSPVSLAVQKSGHMRAPMIVSTPSWDEPVEVEVVMPEHPEEKWVSLLLGMSRGCSHEQVRHKWRTAISQRSTRYVDESDSPWVRHPLVSQFGEATETALQCGYTIVHPDPPAPEDHVALVAADEVCGQIYRETVGHLQPWLETRGVDKHTARKQSRGAARGYLGNALHTELIFSASVAQWHRMIAQRCSRFADAEIRVLYGHVLRALKATRWAEDFAHLTLVPSPDGIGEVVE